MISHEKLTALLKRYEKSKQDRDFLTSYWRDVSDFVRPVKDAIDIEPNIHEQGLDRARIQALFDTSAIDANRTYAAGCMSWMTPSETTWFAFEAPHGLEGDDNVKSWYSRCSDIARQILARSNFYQNIHECYLDDGAFGTSGLIIEEGGDAGIRFEALQIGAYTILENDDRRVDTVFRTLGLTHRQAIQKFGEKNVSEKVREMMEKNQKELDQKGEYIHVVMPRADADRTLGKIDAGNMPWASIYIDCKAKKVVRESGAWEMPIPVNRHALWSHLPYGFSPGMQALSDCRQLNYMQQYLDALVEKQVSPPTLLPSSFEGVVDLRAGGATYYRPDEPVPTFWPNQGNYSIGDDRTLFRREQINRAFHVELFQALAAVPVGKEMTAAEVHMRQRDRLTLFSPTFARKNTELNTPVMKRMFGILLRGGAFPEPPPNLVQVSPEGLPFIPDPEISYTSRMALQLRAIHNESFLRAVDSIGPMIEAQPELMDHIDGDAVTRGIARNEGVPEDWIRPEMDVEEIRRVRAQRQAQLEEEASMHEEADSVAKLAKAGVAAA